MEEVSTTTGELPEGWTESWDSGLTVPYSQIPAIEATALWPGVIPNRTPALFVAPGGTGKGLFVARIAAMTSTGEPFPGEQQPREPGQVIIVAPEDDANEDMAFRLRAAGADLTLVKDLTVLPSGTPFQLPAHFPELRRAVTEANQDGPPVKLVALDPLQAICTDGVDNRRSARAIAWPLQELARDYGGAVIASHHTTKNEKVVAGSQELTNALRLVWLISRAPDDPAARVMTTWKTNRRAGDPVRFRIEGEDEDARVTFTGPETAAPGSRAARLRLAESPATAARRWLDEHPEPVKAGTTAAEETAA